MSFCFYLRLGRRVFRGGHSPSKHFCGQKPETKPGTGGRAALQPLIPASGATSLFQLGMTNTSRILLKILLISFCLGFLQKKNKRVFSSTQNCFSPLERPEVKLLKSFVSILTLKCVPKLAFLRTRRAGVEPWTRASFCWAGRAAPTNPPPTLSHLLRCVICVTSPRERGGDVTIATPVATQARARFSHITAE